MKDAQTVTLTSEQVEALPDLVAFAITGYALMRAVNGPNARDHPKIAPFLPLIQSELDQRTEAFDARVTLRFGGHA